MDTERLNEIAVPLIEWFSGHARLLPWRERPDAIDKLPARELSYRVWVSEIMLQQTRVEAVKPYFHRFMEALPDIPSLAACQEERLLKLWEGLGYYNRVRNMQKAAIIVTAQYGGFLPDTYERLLALPGIGSYTAGAIASIAYGRVVPAVDGNVLRVISRICGNEEDISRQSVKTRFEQELLRVMEQAFGAQAQGGSTPARYFSEKSRLWHTPGTFNQSLMELGATVCLPGGVPLCGECPVKDICYARETGRQMELPVKAARKARKVEERTVLVIRDSERGAVCRRPSRGLLAGLYELPNLDGHLDQKEVLARVEAMGFSPIRIQPLPPAKHIFSHIEWHMIGYMILVEDTEPGAASAEDVRSTGAASPDLLFVELRRTEQEYPIPAAFAAYVQYLSIRLGQDKYK